MALGKESNTDYWRRFDHNNPINVCLNHEVCRSHLSFDFSEDSPLKLVQHLQYYWLVKLVSPSLQPIVKLVL